MPGIAVNTLERSHAKGGFGEPSCARVQGRQLLIQSQISGRLGQGRHQRSERLGRHIVRNKQLGIRHCRTYRKRGFVVVPLLHERRRRFQLIGQHRALFRRNQVGPAGRSLLCQHLLIILRVDLVFGFQLRKFEVILARFFQIARLHIGVGQQFINFRDVSALARFLENL